MGYIFYIGDPDMLISFMYDMKKFGTSLANSLAWLIRLLDAMADDTSLYQSAVPKQ
jgi:hypothetical protein